MQFLIEVDSVTHQYPASRRGTAPVTALKEVSFNVPAGEMFCLLGPNGSGKSTLFRVLSTMLVPLSGRVIIAGKELRANRKEVREQIGVVFQHPSLDDKLTVLENLLFQGHFYALSGKALQERIQELLVKVGLTERSRDLVEHLSGGTQRRVELAKALLHNPRLLILDEPSTGLDPIARREFVLYLRELSRETGLTVLFTSHILEEAELFDRIGIMDRGSLVTLGSPGALKAQIGGEVITIETSAAEELSGLISRRFSASAAVVEGTVRVEIPNGHSLIPQIVEAYPGKIEAITLSRPSLEDVFIHHTGHTFRNGASA